MAITETVSTVTATARALAEALLAMREKLGTKTEAEQALMAVQSQVISLQSNLLELQAKILELQEENAKLRAENRDRAAGAAQKVEYQRKKVGQSWVMVRESDDTDAYYCPACIDNGHEVLIQPHPMPLGTTGTHACPFCGTDFRL